MTLTRVRLTNRTADDVATRQRLVSIPPGAGRQFGNSTDREVSQARKYRAKIVANRQFESPTGFNDRDDRCNAWAAIFVGGRDMPTVRDSDSPIRQQRVARSS
jgi:hypothetical protein